MVGKDVILIEGRALDDTLAPVSPGSVKYSMVTQLMLTGMLLLKWKVKDPARSQVTSTEPLLSLVSAESPTLQSPTSCFLCILSSH